MSSLYAYVECFKNWNVEPASELKLSTADCIVGFSMGIRDSWDMGTSNEFLSEIIWDLSERYNLPIMIQWELGECDFNFDLPSNRIVRCHRVKGEYLDTFEVADQMQIELMYQPLTRPIVVAHPHHMWRCLKSMEKRGFQPMAADTKNVPYDRQSAQGWTKDPILFVPREIAGRLTFTYQGRI